MTCDGYAVPPLVIGQAAINSLISPYHTESPSEAPQRYAADRTRSCHAVSRYRSSVITALMRLRLGVVGAIRAQHVIQMLLAQDQQLVQTLLAHGIVKLFVKHGEVPE